MVNIEREAVWEERVVRWQASGLSQRAFAMQEGYPVRQVGLLVAPFVGGTRSPGNDAGQGARRRASGTGKKYWLFVSSERAGRRAAAIRTLLGTAKLNGLDPLHWLASVLERLSTCPNSQIDSSLPFPYSTQLEAR